MLTILCGTPLQYSCLENPMDGVAWWAAIYGVTQSRTRLKQLSRSSSNSNHPLSLQNLVVMQVKSNITDHRDRDKYGGEVRNTVRITTMGDTKRQSEQVLLEKCH